MKTLELVQRDDKVYPLNDADTAIFMHCMGGCFPDAGVKSAPAKYFTGQGSTLVDVFNAHGYEVVLSQE